MEFKVAHQICGCLSNQAFTRSCAICTAASRPLMRATVRATRLPACGAVPVAVNALSLGDWLNPNPWKPACQGMVLHHSFLTTLLHCFSRYCQTWRAVPPENSPPRHWLMNPNPSPEEVRGSALFTWPASLLLSLSGSVKPPVLHRRAALL